MNRSGVALASVMLVLMLPAWGEDDKPVEHLELLYATSVAMPEDLYGPENVFDGDPGSCWVTMPGAAPDEGLFFTFEEPVYISSMEVMMAPESCGYEDIYLYQLYINGFMTSSYFPGERVNLDANVKSVFIQIKETGSMNLYASGIRYGEDDPVGIGEVTLFVPGQSGTEVPLMVSPIRNVEGTVEASSCLSPEEAYCPDFLFDSRPSFGWADGNEDLGGEGESLLITFDRPRRIERIKIWNGYHRSETHYVQNERAARISFGPYRGDPGVYVLEDVMEPQVIDLDYPVEADSFMLDVLEVYPGDTYRDLVISELRFFDGRDWFIVDSGSGRQRKMEVLEWAGDNPAAAFVDRQVTYRGINDDADLIQNIIIRSNGSFVLWKSSLREGGGGETMYADGNWQVIDDRTLRIFGKLQRVPESQQVTFDPYSGVRPDFLPEDVTRTTIFCDTLEFDGETISSSRGLFQDFSY